MDEKKYKSVIVIWGVIFLILHTLSLINVVGIWPEFFTYLTKLIISFVALVVLALVMIYMHLSLKKKKTGPIIGIMLGAIYILNFDYEHIFISVVNFVAGVCFIISCAGMLKYISETRKEVIETSEKQTEDEKELKKA